MSQTRSIETDTVHNHLLTLDGVVPKAAWGETSYFYNPGLRFERGTYFATIKQKDGENDRRSGLDRSGIWRLNMGVSKESFASLFGILPARPGKGQTVEGPWDFWETDRITPHPVYGWMSWIAVLNPSAETWARCHLLLKDAHDRAVANFDKRVRDLERKGRH
jgi:hypothetical protein